MTMKMLLRPGTPPVAQFGPSTMAKEVTRAADAVPSTVKRVALDRGDVLRIRDGQGTRILVVSGVLWVTEENGSEDHVVLPGDAAVLSRTGTAIALAHHVSRVVLEVPTGVRPPRAVDTVPASGKSGRRIALGEPTPLSTIATGIAALVASALASMRSMLTTLGSRWDAADASTVEMRVPMIYTDGYPPRHLRRLWMYGTREPARKSSKNG